DADLGPQPLRAALHGGYYGLRIAGRANTQRHESTHIDGLPEWNINKRAGFLAEARPPRILDYCHDSVLRAAHEVHHRSDRIAPVEEVPPGALIQQRDVRR